MGHMLQVVVHYADTDKEPPVLSVDQALAKGSMYPLPMLLPMFTPGPRPLSIGASTGGSAMAVTSDLTTQYTATCQRLHINVSAVWLSGDVEAALASAKNVARNVKVKLPSQVRCPCTCSAQMSGLHSTECRRVASCVAHLYPACNVTGL
jgi:hypothetical protein